MLPFRPQAQKDRQESEAQQAEAQRLRSLYDPEGLRKRYGLLQHPSVINALERLWVAANTSDEDAIIDKAAFVWQLLFCSFC